jgi:uncharacterized protein with PQ loop repeat
MSWGELFGFVAGALGVIQGAPQAARVRRLGHGAGVSMTMWLLMFTSNSLWTGYGLEIGAPSLVVSNVLTAIIGAWVVVALRGRAAVTIALMVAWAATMLGLVAVLPRPVLSGILIAMTMSRVPQVVRSAVTLRKRAASAVSMSSLAVSVTCLVFWEIYAIVERRPLVGLTTTLAMSTVLSVVGIELVGRRRHRRAANLDASGAVPDAGRTVAPT